MDFLIHLDIDNNWLRWNISDSDDPKEIATALQLYFHNEMFETLIGEEAEPLASAINKINVTMTKEEE